MASVVDCDESSLPNGVNTDRLFEHNRKIFYCSVTGAIGSGKSSLINTLVGRHENASRSSSVDYDIVFEQEPVKEWENDRGTNWLKMFYDDPERWSFAFQMKVVSGQVDMKKRIESQTREDKPLIVITERSPFDGRNIFSSLLVESQKMKPHELNLLSDYIDKVGWLPDFTIWVDASPESCVERIRRREREAELSVDEEYYGRVCSKYRKEMSILEAKTPEQFLHIDNDSNVVESMSLKMNDCAEIVERWIRSSVIRKN